MIERAFLWFFHCFTCFAFQKIKRLKKPVRLEKNQMQGLSRQAHPAFFEAVVNRNTPFFS